MDLVELKSAVRTAIRERSTELGLEGECVEVEYVLNWGGFVNHSFRVSDGRRRLHLKLAGDPVAQDALRRWLDLGEALEPYHAPPIVAWVDLPVTRFAGSLTEWIDGQAPDRFTRELAGRVLPVIARLHADAGIAARLAPAGASTSCAETYLTTYGERFTEDLEHIARHRPAFVTDPALRVMREEAARIEGLVRGSPAFREPARSPIHADLWTENFLLTAGGAWHLLDWDDLQVGDPVLDLAMLLGPSAVDMRPADCSDVEPFLRSDAERERFAVHTRARLLDWAIDSLADYIEADAAPEHAAEVRVEKQRLHVEALDRYVALYLD